MHFYRAGTERKMDAQEILSAIRSAVPSLYPGLKHEAFLLLPGNLVHQQVFFMDEKTSQLIWGRVFCETLNFSLLEEVREEFRRIQIALKDFTEEGKGCKAFVFFPSVAKGAAELFSEFAGAWSFLEYQFLNSDQQDGLVLKEYFRQSQKSLKSDFSPLLAMAKEESFSPRWLKRFNLTREEHLELIEIALDLKEITIPQ